MNTLLNLKRVLLWLLPQFGTDAEFVHPFSGWPGTCSIENGWRIDTWYLTPGGANMIQTIRDGAACMGVGGFFLLYNDDLAPFGVFLMGSAAFLWLGSKSLMLAHITLDLTPEALTVNGRRRYDLSLPHQFDMIPHPKRVPLEFRKRTQGGQPVRSHLDKAFVIRFHYAGMPIHLIEIYDETNAFEMLARLQTVDQVVQQRPEEERERTRPGD